MAVDILMPALSPTMEEGTLAKWLVKTGDRVRSGDVLAEIETDKATMEFEAADEGTVASIAVAEGADGVKVGTVIATLSTEGEESGAAPQSVAAETLQPADGLFRGRPEPTDPEANGNEGAPASREVSVVEDHGPPPTADVSGAPTAPVQPIAPAATGEGDVQEATPLARRLAAQLRLDLSTIVGSGPSGRVMKADVVSRRAAAAPALSVAMPVAASVTAPTPAKPAAVPDVPHTTAKLSNMRKTIARRLTESKQQVPHIYLTVDIRLDAMLELRGELNAGLTTRTVKLSINDMMVKALATALMEVPSCNVMFTPEQLISFERADISVAVSTPTGLITPVVTGAEGKSISAISTEIKELAGRAREGKLKPEEFAGGTASISNMGMYGIKQFEAVINPPQGMILAVGAGERRPWVMPDDIIDVATVMSATGSFDHRSIDGADGAELMRAFKSLVEAPLALLA